MRTFIALDLPSDFVTGVAQIENQLAASMEARYVPLQNLHVTLAFMGELQTSTQLAAAQRAIEVAAKNFAPVSLHPDGLGYFGSATDATVWMGISPTPALMNLAKSIRSELATKGLPFEDTPFKPHITLARHARTDQANLNSFRMPDTAHATTVTIYESELAPQGATYKALHSVKL